MKKYLLFAICYLLFAPVANAVDLTGAASVNITSDTAATAKTMALAEARRQIIGEVLTGYAPADELAGLLGAASDVTLSDMVSSVGISNEKTSSTTYSADIRMTVDSDLAAKWLDENEVANRLSTPADTNTATVVANISGLRDWISLNRALRARNIDFNVVQISDGAVTIAVPSDRVAVARSAIN